MLLFLLFIRCFPIFLQSPANKGLIVLFFFLNIVKAVCQNFLFGTFQPINLVENLHLFRSASGAYPVQPGSASQYVMLVHKLAPLMPFCLFLSAVAIAVASAHKALRSKRGLLELAGAIKCSTGRFALAYMMYGCYCGLGGQGWPRDKADW